ncbi:E3 ubiquitin ligase family protein [Oscillochloris sp. ZM17-4]|uniref:E3 ubiquitin ligase family protein n=1 Tax=Oscillochloris sp. ZM17-4 TaxID=2866714 RepID=UPI001C739FA4|nr:E3 ubiquitin ligase family protein [Oscillochloris sp. ZM17-4]MBX0327059.1 E3 ubiquitin ligase family protein [Oscillochloris sp. ZM17-4]
MVFGGFILIIIAVICFFVARSNASSLTAMNAAETYTAQLLAEVHRKITSSLGADALAQVCEVEGTIECEKPLHGPVSKQPCVAYSYSQTREYEERVTKTDANSKRETTVERRSESLKSEDRQVSFYVRDATGRTLVLPEDAELDLAESGSRFDAAEQPWTGATRTLGQRHSESSLAPGTRVYVLGTAVDHQGQPAITRHPANAKQRFLVSRKSERELAGSAATWSRNMYYAAAGSGALGLIVLVLGLLMG